MPGRRAALLGALVAASVLAGCGGGRDALTIYSGRGEHLVGPLLERFSADTGIPIDVRYGDSADLALLIAEEGDRTPADVFFSQSPGAVGFLAGRGVLGELSGDVLDRVDERFRSPTGRWVGVTGRQRVLVYNTEQVPEDELPASVFALTDERYRGRVGVAPQNASFQDFVTAMRKLEGDARTLEWLEAMAANEARVYPNNNAIVAAVARGEIPMGLVNHYYNHRYLAEEPDAPSRNHQFGPDDPGSLMLVATASVLAASQDDRAERLVEYLLSEDAQEFFRDETFEYPLVDDVQASAELPPLRTLEVPDYGFEEFGDALEETTELIARSGLDQ